jgi:GT2 family glycosyltransferase
VEAETQQAPPVVAVVVVHDPGAWFDEALDAFAAQDYPNVRFLFLDTSGDAGASPGEEFRDVAERVAERLPDAFVRRLGANPGFGAAANEVLRLVDGDNGFFLFCHDDVAPDPSAVRLMVEELYRSNAGAVGPKIVDWHDPHVLQSVGLGMDRFGEIDVGIEPGEVDQEQHDGVRDVFVLPSACLLIRADLFRAVGGFDPAIDFYGDDVELCWRIHYNGARVVVVPSARARHLAQLPVRRPDLSPRTLAARHRMRSVATLTGSGRLPGRSLEMVLLTIAELVVGLFSGRFAEAWASLRAFVGLIPRTGSILARRRVVKPLRRVPERDVAGLQERGSTRINHYLRSRETATFVGTESSVRRWRQSAASPVIAWIVVLVALLVGSRSLLGDGFPPVGEFLPFPESPRRLLESYASGWNSLGVGTTAANPTGWATIGLASVATLFRMGLLHTLFIIGLVIAGIAGMSRLVAVFPSTRARVAGMLVYAASPLVGGAMSIGSLNTLVAFASTPWILHLMRRAVGVETADPRSAPLDLVDGLVQLDAAERIRRTLACAIVVALATAFVPVMWMVSITIAIVMVLATLLALASWRTAAGYLVVGVVAGGIALLLNLPWFSTWSWDALVGAPPIGNPGRGFLDVAAFEIGVSDFAYLSLALYLPVVAAIMLARAWRLTWAVRAAMLVLAFGALAVLADRDALPFRGPEAGILLVPVAVGLGISAGAALAAFDLDVRGGSFGWRQPLGLLASAAVIVGLVPGIAALGDGAWNTPSTPLASLLDRRFTDTSDGRFNVLMIGDARVLPVPSVEYRDGISWAVADDGALDIRDRWATPDTEAASAIEEILDEVATASTQRAGQLLAPLGIRYIVVPEFDGVMSTTDHPIAPPLGLVDALDDQLDVVSIPGLPTIELFENRAWIPAISELGGATAEASLDEGAASLVRADLTDATAVFPDADPLSTSTNQLQGGVVHLAVPYDDQWKLTVDGVAVESRPSFGIATAFDAPSGMGELRYETGGGRTFLVVLQTALWLLVLFGATRVSLPFARRRIAAITDETLIDLDDDSIPIGQFETHVESAPVAAGILRDPGLDATGELARPPANDDEVAEVDPPTDDGERP